MSLLAHQGLLMQAAQSSDDPHYDDVVSLLNFIEADGATATTDAKGLAWSFFGNAQIDTAASANGISSLLLDGTGDFITTADSPAMRLGVSIFTIEAFVRVNSSKIHSIFNSRNLGGTAGGGLYVQPTGVVQFLGYSGGAVINLTSTATIAAGAFHHVEIGKAGAVWYLFVDGNLEASGTQTGGISSGADPFRIGRDGFKTDRDLDGWIGGFRRTNGIIRHTSSFTPPTAPFPIS